jgi:4-amino-4-deoxy-L-arabinose transferase-like glycosyltransferase
MWLASAVFGVTLLAGAAFGAGFWIEDQLPSSFAPLERLAFIWLGGLGTLSICLFLIGQFAFTRAFILGTVAVSLFFAIRPVRRLLHTEPSLWKIRIDAITAAVIILILLVTAVGGLAEINGDVGHDAIAYHLLGPKVWLHDGIIRPLPETSTTAFPATAEVLFGALFTLGGVRGPGCFALLTLACFFVVVYSLARGAGLDERASWWAVAFVAAMPAVYIGAHSAFIDVLYATFILAAARVGFEAQRTSEWVIFGIFCGLAMATKYTGLTATPVLVFCAVLARVPCRRAQWSTVVKYGAVAILTGSLVASPYYIRNWILLGCPIYPPPPLLANLVPVKFFPPENLRRFYAYLYARGSGLGRGLFAYFLLPYNLTYYTSFFNGAGGIGLTGLAFGPFGLFAARTRVFPRILAVLGVLLTTSWFVTLQESRYLIPAYPIAAVFAAMGWKYLQSEGGRSTRILCGAVIACSLLYGLFMIVSSRQIDLRRVFSASFAEKYHEERIPYLRSFEYLNSEPSVKLVLILDSGVPVYYLDKSYLKPFGQWGEQVLPEVQDAMQALREVDTLKVSHIMDVRSNVSDFQVPENMAGLKLVFQTENQRVYRVQ